MYHDRELPLTDDIERLVLCLDAPIPVERGELCCALRPYESAGNAALQVLRRIHAHNLSSPRRRTHPDAPAVTVLLRFPSTAEGASRAAEVSQALEGKCVVESRPLRHFRSYDHAQHALRGIRPETLDHLWSHDFPTSRSPTRVSELLLTASPEDLYAYEQTHLHDNSRVRAVYVDESDRGHIDELIQHLIDLGTDYNRKLGLPPPVLHVIAPCSSTPAGQALEKQINNAAAHFGPTISTSIERPIFGRTWAEYVACTERDWIRQQHQLAREDGIAVPDHDQQTSLVREAGITVPASRDRGPSL